MEFIVSHQVVILSNQPLTAPEIMPWKKNFCKKIYDISIGAVISTDEANTKSQRV